MNKFPFDKPTSFQTPKNCSKYQVSISIFFKYSNMEKIKLKRLFLREFGNANLLFGKLQNIMTNWKRKQLDVFICYFFSISYQVTGNVETESCQIGPCSVSFSKNGNSETLVVLTGWKSGGQIYKKVINLLGIRFYISHWTLWCVWWMADGPAMLDLAAGREWTE